MRALATESKLYPQAIGTVHLLGASEPLTWSRDASVQERGLKVPDDLAIVGFDDLPQTTMIYPELTTIRQPCVEMGACAAEMLIRQLEQAICCPRAPPGWRLRIRAARSPWSPKRLIAWTRQSRQPDVTTGRKPRASGLREGSQLLICLLIDDLEYGILYP